MKSSMGERKGDNITLDTWFDIWLNTPKKRTIKESTQVRYDDFTDVT